jgi:hypothetical protein
MSCYRFLEIFQSVEVLFYRLYYNNNHQATGFGQLGMKLLNKKKLFYVHVSYYTFFEMVHVAKTKHFHFHSINLVDFFFIFGIIS